MSARAFESHGSLASLWRLSRGERLRYGGAILALWVGSALLFLVPLVVQASFDGILGGARAEESAGGAAAARLAAIAARAAERVGPGGALLLAAAAMLGLSLLAGLAQFVQELGAARSAEALARRLRLVLFERLARVPMPWIERADSGDLVQRCTSDVETVRAFLATQVIEIARALLPLAVAVPLMAWLDVRMTLASLAVAPLVLGFSIVFFRRVQTAFLAMDEAEARMTTVLQENLTGIRVVRAFGREPHEEAKFGAANADFRDRTYGLMRVLSGFWPLVDLLTLAQMGLVLFLAAARLREGSLSVGEFFAFTTYVALLVIPLRVLGRVLTEAGKATVALRRIEEVLEVRPEPDGERASARAGAGHLVVRGLAFAYPEGPPVLRGIDFEIRPGEWVALVGPPGSGKSTVVALLARLYDYEGGAHGQGSILLDGEELSELTRAAVRARIGALLQEPFLFSRSVRENLTAARPEASEAELERNVRRAELAQTIARWEQGYQTQVGERGLSLSGGQRQRMALARALLAEPDLLLIDDALSAVDTRTEARILAALEERRGRRGTLFVTHRLASAARADRILVLEQGRIVESGTHAELVSAGGTYARLWAIQEGLEREIEAESAELGAESAERGAESAELGAREGP